MKKRKIGSILLALYVLLFLILQIMFVPQVGGASIKIEYEYNSLRICIGARSTMDGAIVGKADLEDLVKGKHYIVRESHYSPRTGTIIYEGRSKFAIGGGMKIEEIKIGGQKIMEIFRSWP